MDSITDDVGCRALSDDVEPGGAQALLPNIMITPLLQTKLHIPPVRCEIVRRPRLLDAVNSRPQLKLALITAPAGFGKTTLASAWLSQTKKRVAWVSVDEGENDLKRFLTYMLTALHQIASEVGQTALEVLNEAEPASAIPILTYLINDLACAKTPLILAIDDYHHIHAQAVHDAVTFLLDNLPPQLQIVLISRTEPPLPLARLRSRFELIELGTADLRFTWHEAEAFLNQTMRLGLSRDQITALESRTEGWITGLQLIALSLKDADDAGRLIQGISGNDRYIADYLVDEVLSRQPIELQQFLLQTSFLTRMNADLCNQVLGIANSQQILNQLQENNLFVIPLDNTRTWFRYHHLFAELLLRRFLSQPAAEIEERHRRAAQWCFAHHMPEEAIGHALDAQDYGVVVEYLQNKIDDEILAKGRFKVYLEWLDRIPDEHLIDSPKLILYRVFQLWEMQQLEKFAGQLQLIEQMLGPIPDDAIGLDPMTAANYGILSIIKGVVLCGDFAVEQASVCFGRALRLLPEESVFWRTLSLGATGFCLRIQGNYVAADQYFAQVVDFAMKANLTLLCFMYGLARVQVCLAHGELQTALRVCQSLLALDAGQGGQLPFAGVAYTLMGELLYTTGSLAAAEKQTRRGLELVTKDGDARHIADSYFALASIQIAHGEPAEAIQLMDQMMHALETMQAPQSALLMARTYQANVWIDCNRLQQAKWWNVDPGDVQVPGDRFADIQGLPYFGVYCTVYATAQQTVRFIHFTQARYELAAGNAPVALQKVDKLLTDETGSEDVYFRTQLLILKAQALHACNRPDQAAQTIREAIWLVAPEPFIQPFVHAGPAIWKLLAQVRESLMGSTRLAPDDAHASTLIEQILAQVPKPEAAPAVSAKPRHSLVTDLSPREIEVLLALSRGISYVEMTNELLISENTVKTYLKRIYNKLDATNRLQAVNKAKELGLLS
jgi:LuxR family maltose regulon positive regulatory protein